MRQWWIARWKGGKSLDYEYLFEGPTGEDGARSRMIANLSTMGVHRPETYTLARTEVRLEEMTWNYPKLVPSNKPRETGR